MGSRWPGGGRVAACQCSVAMGLPLSCLVLKGLPTVPVGDGTTNSLALTYGAAMLLMGCCISWSAPSTYPLLHCRLKESQPIIAECFEIACHPPLYQCFF